MRVKGVALRRPEALQQQARRSPEAHALFWASLKATLAHFQHADSWRLRTRILRRLGVLEEQVLTPAPSCRERGA